MNVYKSLLLIPVFLLVTFNGVSQSIDTLITPINSSIIQNDSIENISNTLIEKVAIIPKDSTNIISSDSLDTQKDSLTRSNVDDTLNSVLDSTVTVVDTSNAVIDTIPLPDVSIEFIKESVEHSPDSIYFNICKVTNNTEGIIEGNFELNIPNTWNIISNPSSGIVLQPGEIKYFTVRLSISNKSVGGIAYGINALLTTKNSFYSGATFVKIPLIQNWKMHIDDRIVYFDEFFDEQTFNVHISNRGNADELIKLNFEIGKLFEIEEIFVPEIYVSVPAQTDTSFVYTLKKKILSEDEEYTYKQIWKESIVNIKAESGSSKITETIQFIDLENEYVNERKEKSSPLNFELSMFNLLSSIQPRLNARVFGQIQFRQENDFTYFVQARNLNFSTINSSYIQNAYNYTFRLTHDWKKVLSTELGEITNTGLHSFRGWGLKSTYKIDDKNKVTASVITGKYFPVFGLTARYDTRIKNISTHIAAIYEDNDLLYYDALSIEAGASYTILRNHMISATILGTRALFDKNQGLNSPIDTTVYGLSYLASYSGKYKKFKFGANTNNSQLNYIRIRPSNTINGYVRYRINAKSRLRAIARYRSSASSKLKFIPHQNGSYNTQYMYRATYNRTINKKLSIQAGPTYRILNRVRLDSFTVSSDFTNNFLGLYGLARIRFEETKTISTSASVGYTSFVNNLNPSDSLLPMPTFNFGVNYSDRNWGANANYIYGPNYFITEDILNYNATGFETVNLRAYYNKFFFHRKIKFAGYANYYLRLPSNQQNFAVSSRFDFYLPKKWNAYITSNLYNNSVDDELSGITKHRNFTLNLGVKKSFNIPQPRIKYYELTVICFNDIDGNGTREKNEPLLSNIKVDISQNINIAKEEKIIFGEKKLVSGTNGALKIIDIPEGDYKLKFLPLINLGNLYNVNGDKQLVIMSGNTTLYVPYVESYKVKGKVVLNRDEYSSLGYINLGGIRVTATNTTTMKSYPALTTNDGSYMISVPKGGDYKVKVHNIFGSAFEIDKEYFLIQFGSFKSFNVDFTFFEGKREVDFGENSYFNFASLNAVKEEPLKIGNGVLFSEKELNIEINKISYENIKNIRKIENGSELNHHLCIGIFDDKINPVELQKLRALGFAKTDYKINDAFIYISKGYETENEIDDFKTTVEVSGFSNLVKSRNYQGRILTNNDLIKLKNR